MKFKKKIYGSPVVNQHIAKITGQKTHIRPYVWISGNKKYSHITGGMVLPTFTQHGFLLTIGVEPDTNNFHVIDEYESEDPYQIIKKAQGIQKDYGPGVIENWWGNPADLMSIVNEVNIEGNPILISQPIDFDMPDSFALYVTRLKTSLAASHKTFFIGDGNILRNHLLSFVEDKTAKPDSYPVVDITGSLIHTLLIMRPWEQSVDTMELIPTTHEDYAEYESEKAIRDLEMEIYA